MDYVLVLFVISAVLFFVVIILEIMISRKNRKIKNTDLYDRDELQELDSHQIFLLGFTGELFVYFVLGLAMYGTTIFLSEPKSEITYALLTMTLSIIFLSINIVRYRKLAKEERS